MKTNIIVLLALAFLLPLGITSISSCGSTDDVLCAFDFASDTQDELQAVLVAQQAYNADQTTANCNAYKSAMQAYINALEPYGDCAALSGVARAQWQDELEEWRDEVADVSCD